MAACHAPQCYQGCELTRGPKIVSICTCNLGPVMISAGDKMYTGNIVGKDVVHTK